MKKMLAALVPVLFLAPAAQAAAPTTAPNDPPRYLKQEIHADSPIAYYTLDEPAGATSAADTSGNQTPALTMAGTGTAVRFGNGVATFTGGKYLRTTSNTLFSAQAFECLFSVAARPQTAMPLLANDGPVLSVGRDGRLHTNVSDLSGPVVTDGRLHDVVWQFGHVFLDGVDIGAPSLYPSADVNLRVGGADATSTVGGPYATFVGTIAHVAAFPSALTPARALAHYQASFSLRLMRVVARLRHWLTEKDARIRRQQHVIQRQSREIRRLKAELG